MYQIFYLSKLKMNSLGSEYVRQHTFLTRNISSSEVLEFQINFSVGNFTRAGSTTEYSAWYSVVHTETAHPNTFQNPITRAELQYRIRQIDIMLI